MQMFLLVLTAAISIVQGSYSVVKQLMVVSRKTDKCITISLNVLKVLCSALAFVC